MILIDTSVLIDFFKGKKNEKTKRLEEAIENQTPFGICNLIYQEVLQGAKNEKEFEKLKEYLSTQKFYELKNGKASYEKAAEIYFQCRKQGVTIKSTIDILIAQICLENKLVLLHNDEDYVNIGKVIKEFKQY